MIDDRFDRFLRYSQLVEWIEQPAAASADLVAVETLAQLAGSSSAHFTNGTASTPARTSCSRLVRAAAGTSVTVRHQRAGSDSEQLALDR